MEIKIISVGGSIIIPSSGFNISFLKKFKKLILDEVKNGTKFILVIGGGSTARIYQQGLRDMGENNPEILDWMGIHTTRINARFVKYMFEKYAYSEVLYNPNQKVKTNKPIIIAGGEKPGQSTDMVAVRYAKTYGANEVINMSNLSYVYDKDPHTYKNAKKIKEIDWKTFRKDVVGMTWVPGKHAPFDPTASTLAQKLKLKVTIMNGTDLKEVKKAVRGEKCRGTIVM